MKESMRVFVLAASALVLGAVHASQPATRAQTGSGGIEGIVQGRAIAFLGVPYAAPPVGMARWRPPAPVAHWSGIRKAAHFAPSCPQVINPPEGRAPWTPEYLIPGPTSEDCLYLNVWRPLMPTKERMPILFWIHGGGFREGSGSVPVYDGAALSAEGVVVVTVNYRLGVLGLLAHPALSVEQHGVSGNYGLQDILAALRWVHANAAAFGGDAARITIAGQSAGAGAVQDLIAAPLARGLFARAITESGSGWGADLPTRHAAEAQGLSFAKSIGATSLAELRKVPADELVKAAAAPGFSVIVDGAVLPADPKRALLAGTFNDTPILSGVNADEGSGLRPADYGRPDLQAFVRRRDQQFGPLAAQAAEIYAAASDADAGQLDKALTRDRSLAWTYEWARRRAAVSHQPIYVYFYGHTLPGPTADRYGAFHTSEVPYVFRTLDVAQRPYTAVDRRVSAQMSGRWLSFIRGNAPDVPGTTGWPPFRPEEPLAMRLGDTERPEAVLPPEKRRLFDALVEQGGTLALY